MTRRLLILAAFLLAGLVVNVAVAWGISLRVNNLGSSDDWAYLTGPTSVCTVRRYSAFGTTRYSYGRQSTRYTSGRQRTKSDPRSATPFPVEIMPGWPGLEVPTPEFRAGELFSEARVIEGRGWPRRSMWCERSRSNSPINPPFTRREVPLDGGIKIHGTALGMTLGKGAYRLPLRPIWSGFAVNTLVYAAIFWLLIPGPFALRRLVRVKRGLCPACAYDLRHGEHDACPECGRLAAAR